MKKRLRMKLAKRQLLRLKRGRKSREGLSVVDAPPPVLQGRECGRNVAPVQVSERAEIYRSELEYILRCILERPEIETGGELFGFWKDDGTPVVTYVIGPGPKANHEYAFFNQDIAYLSEVGSVLTGKFGLEHIGEWHSHHSLGLAHPSGHDASTIAHGMAAHRRNRFLLCIGTCSDRSARLGGFAFLSMEGEEFSHVDWHVFGVESPYRRAIDGDVDLAGILVHPLAMEEIRHGKKSL